MNRVGVIKGLYTNAAGVGLLQLTNTNDTFVKPSVIAMDVFLNDLTKKSLGHINPRHFDFAVQKYASPGNITVKLGYNGTTGNLSCLDPSLSLNLNKFGTFSIKVLPNAGLGYTPKWGASFDADVYIKQGDTTATIYARLKDEILKQVDKVQAKYGSASVVLSARDIVSGNKYFTFTGTIPFAVTLDGIFDGTTHTTTAADVVDRLGGVEVIKKEKEAAVLDGYNPTQTDKFQTFNISNYCLGVIDKTYDCIIVRTTSDAKYESPTFHGGWDLEVELYCERVANDSNPANLGACATAIVAALQAIKDEVPGQSSMAEISDAIDTAIAAIP